MLVRKIKILKIVDPLNYYESIKWIKVEEVYFEISEKEAKNDAEKLLSFTQISIYLPIEDEKMLIPA